MLRLMSMRPGRASLWLSGLLLLCACGAGATASSDDDSDASPSPAPAGDVAFWETDPSQPPEANARSFTALVRRLGCASGVTGDVLQPRVVESEREVVVTFTVAPQSDGGLCPMNKAVPYSVKLAAALGARSLRDGTCDAPPANTTAACLSPQRWPSTPRTGPVEDKGSAASCVEGYSTETLRNRAFAFDGTIVSIGPAGTNKPDKGQLPTASVRFRVNEWFKGGSEDTAIVDLMSPGGIAGEDTPLYEEGTRLLVSGEPRWGGQPLDDAIAWSCGGFTSYYEAEVSDEWRAALRRG